MSFHWAHIPVGFFYLECDMKVDVSKPKNKRRSMHIFQCLVEMIQSLLGPSICFWQLRAPWHDSAMALLSCSNIVYVWCILRFDEIYHCASTTITLFVSHFLQRYFSFSVCLAMTQDVCLEERFRCSSFCVFFFEANRKCINVGSAVV